MLVLSGQIQVIAALQKDFLIYLVHFQAPGHGEGMSELFPRVSVVL